MKKVFTFLCFLGFTQFVFGQDGTLDASFGNRGIIEVNTNSPIIPKVIRAQSTGKIIVAGASTEFPSTFNNMRLIRLNSDGTMDRTFGVNGMVTTNFGTPGSYSKEMIIQNDDKIIVVGESTQTNGVNNFALVRYTADGVLDATFNRTGKQVVDFRLGSNINSLANNVALQPDGKILVSGEVDSKMALIRLSPNGVLDTSFNKTGIIIKNNGITDKGLSIIVKEDKKIVVMHRPIVNSSAVVQNILIQYNPNGTLDTQFGTNGELALTPTNSRFRVLKSGKIIVASDTVGINTRDSIYYSLARYNSDGSVDSTFGIGGAIKQKLIYAGFSFTLLDVVEQNDEKIIVGGSVQGMRFTVSTLFRYLKNGVIDTTFGTKGQQITNGGAYWYTESYQGMSLQGDGKILFCSTYYPYARYMRFNNSFRVGIANPTEKNRPLSIFPNPAKNELNIDLKDRVNSDFAIKISDLTGRIVYQNKYDKSLINNIVQINIGDLVSGLYVVTIQTEKEILSQLISKN